jgi:transposase
LHDGFINAEKEVFGKRIRVVTDRFHVAKLYRKGLDNLRKQEMKRLKKELSEEEYKELKDVMWVLMKNKKSLSKDNRLLLKKSFQYSPTLEIAYALQNDLTNIFDMALSRSGGKRRIKNRMRRVEKSGISCYKKFLSTLDSYLEEIVNYFINRDSSGFVEGLNN